MGLFDRSLFSAVSAKFLGIYRLASPDPTDSESSRLQVDIFRFCFHPFEVYPMDSSKMIGNPPEVSNFNRSFSNSTGFICNYPPVLCEEFPLNVLQRPLCSWVHSQRVQPLLNCTVLWAIYNWDMIPSVAVHNRHTIGGPISSPHWKRKRTSLGSTFCTNK